MSIESQTSRFTSFVFHIYITCCCYFSVLLTTATTNSCYLNNSIQIEMLALMISVVLLNYVQVSIGTRLPLEVFDLPQTSSPSPASSSSSSSSPSSSSTTTTTAGELRRSRQMLDILQEPQEHHQLQLSGSNFQTIHETRILYQVGVSTFSSFLLWIGRVWALIFEQVLLSCLTRSENKGGAI